MLRCPLDAQAHVHEGAKGFGRSQLEHVRQQLEYRGRRTHEIAPTWETIPQPGPFEGNHTQ